jgi:hypothetical protein
MYYYQKYLKYKSKYNNLKAGARTRSSTKTSEIVAPTIPLPTPSIFANPEKEIVIDVIGSYILEITTRLMEEIVTYLNKQKRNNVTIYWGFNTKLALTELMNGKYDTNTQSITNYLAPFGEAESTHWIYYDDTGKIHNSYTYEKQVYAGNQYCQTHALLMAFFPEKRIESTPISAYDDLLSFWKDTLFLFFSKLQKSPLYKSVHKLSCDAITEANNKESRINKDYVKVTIDTINKVLDDPTPEDKMSLLFEQIYNIMNSPIAKRLVPEWY